MIQKVSNDIELDGILSEECWKNAIVADDFYQVYPSDSIMAIEKTKVMMCFDDQNIYIAAVCMDNFMEEDFVVSSLRRDYSFPANDAFAVFFDPFNDKTNGFSFSTNPYGVQREGLLESAGVFGVSTAWDNKWFVEVQHNIDSWVVEMKIPFKSIRYKENVTTWGINFARNNLKSNELTSWTKIPINFNVATLNFTGALHWDTPPPKAGMNLAVIPFSQFIL